MATENNLPLYQLREKLAFQYTTALEAGDFETLTAVLQRAATDPVLAAMLREIDEVYEQEAAQAVQTTARPAVLYRQTLPTLTIQPNGHHPRPNYPPRPERRNWATLAAAVILVVLTVTGMVWSSNPAQFAALFGQPTAAPTSTLTPTITSSPSLTPTATPSPTPSLAIGDTVNTQVAITLQFLQPTLDAIGTFSAPPDAIVIPIVPTLLGGIFDEINTQLDKNLSEVNLTLEAVGTYVVLPTIHIPILPTPHMVLPELSLPGQ
ncbi:MAG TPA: hypothetical protein VHO69_11545 [Phototrophicaceae bacterium]|nr:hypothetical protein [Phototrophicaceae bacterium]